MTRTDWIGELRAELRPADPDPALLAQLVALSHGSGSPAVRPGRSVGARLAIALGGAIAVGATSWVAGALPGTDSPFQPEEHVTHQPADPTPGGVETPQPDGSEPPAGERSPSPAGSTGPGGSPSTPGASYGRSTGAQAPEGRAADPPMGADELSQVPRLPTPAPDVPPVPEPAGLDRLPEVPAAPASGVAAPSTTDSDSDSGARRSPRPQEALVPRSR